MADIAKEEKDNFSRNHKVQCSLVENLNCCYICCRDFTRRKYKFFLRQMGIIPMIFFVSMKYKHFKISALEFYHPSYSVAVTVKTRISFVLLTNVFFSRLKQNCFFWHMVTLGNLKQGKILKVGLLF